MHNITIEANAEELTSEFAEIEIDELELREDLLGGGLFSCCPFLPCSVGATG